MFNNKEGYNQAVAQELNRELAAYFVVSQINPGSIAPKELSTVIRGKTESIQNEQKAQLDRRTAEAQAATKIAIAKGDSASLVIAAQAEAEAIKLKTREISANYVEFTKWSKWDGGDLRAGQAVVYGKFWEEYDVISLPMWWVKRDRPATPEEYAEVERELLKSEYAIYTTIS